MSQKNRVIVVSIPKAGTYLVAQLLQQMGVVNSSLHIRYDDQKIGIDDFRNAPLKMSASEKNQCFLEMPLTEALSMIRIGEFGVGHLPPVPEVKKQLYPNFKIIFMVRDLRDCLISHMRYMINIGEITEEKHSWITIDNDKEKFRQYLLNYADLVGPLVNMRLMACWEYDLRNPCQGMEILKLRFEDLTGKDKLAARTAVRGLAEFLQLSLSDDIDSMIQSVINAETQTKSNAMTVREKYWSPFAEGWFYERVFDAQGNNMNEMIGYE